MRSKSICGIRRLMPYCAAQRHHDLHLGVRRPRFQLRQAVGVGVAEALVALLVAVVIVDQDALGFEAGDAAGKRFGLGGIAARRDEGDAELLGDHCLTKSLGVESGAILPWAWASIKASRRSSSWDGRS
jgi:hypothetical protein